MFLGLVLFKANVKKTCYSSIVPLYNQTSDFQITDC